MRQTIVYTYIKLENIHVYMRISTQGIRVYGEQCSQLSGVDISGRYIRAACNLSLMTKAASSSCRPASVVMVTLAHPALKSKLLHNSSNKIFRNKVAQEKLLWNEIFRSQK